MSATLFLSAWLALVPVVSAQETRELESPASEPKARTTVLHLEGGAVLRTRARECADGWEVFTRGEWQLLPAGVVLRARPERELLDEAAKLERSVPRKDLVRRVAYAEWLATEGLRAEALEQLDRVLSADPDQAAALALLARAEIPLALPAANPAELDTFFAASARLSPAGREIAVRRLADEHRPEAGDPASTVTEGSGLRAALARELLARTPGRRTFATLALRRLYPGEEAQGLLSRAVLDASSEVRTSAALALKAFDDPSVIAPALRAAGSKNPTVRENAIAALGRMEYREAVEPLFERLVALQGSSGSNGAPRVHIFNGRQRAYVQDFDVEVAQGQAIADPIINVLTEGSVLDVAVIGVNEYQIASERSALRRALVQLTGENPGETTTAWVRWWKEHGDEWQAGSLPPKAPTTPAGQG
jgi:HEAT repeat protein